MTLRPRPTRLHLVVPRWISRLASASLIAAVLSLSGCTPLNFNLRNFSFNNDDEPATPSRMVPVWTDTVLTRSGKQGVRGFGGRLIFYENSQQLPIHVDGSIVVYAWDDTDESAPDRPPDRKYVITAEELSAHYSESRVGASYSIWIPWDGVGGEHTKVSLVTRYIGSNGAELVSQPITAVLPGPVPDRLVVSKRRLEAVSPEVRQAALKTPHRDAQPSESAILQAGWESPDDDSPASPGLPRMRTTTLDVTPSFAARHFSDNRAPLNVEHSSVNGPAEAEATPAGPAPSTRYAPTPRPAQTERADSPISSPLRTPPRRAKWPFLHSVSPRSESEIAGPEHGTPSTESAAPAQEQRVDLLRSRS